MNIKEFTEYLVKSIVSEPDMVRVSEFGGEDDSYRSPSFATAMGLVLANKGSSSTNKTGKKNRPAEDSAERGKNKKFFKNFLKQFF